MFIFLECNEVFVGKVIDFIELENLLIFYDLIWGEIEKIFNFIYM